ncbi:MAG TPA: hypothetical protein VHA37_08295 [Candidatus Saccharimonadales bacterium]|nr:hypothetical protein [Candidatus Saccharimonadales bacterium]
MATKKKRASKPKTKTKAKAKSKESEAEVVAIETAGEVIQVKTAPPLPTKLRKQITVTGGDDEPQPKKSEEPKKTEESAPEPEPDDKPETYEVEEAAPAAAAPDEFMGQSIDLDDELTDEAVTDIVAHEGDVVLAVADATAAERNQELLGTDTQESTGHSAFAKIFWSLIFILAVISIIVFYLLVTGANVPGLQDL